MIVGIVYWNSDFEATSRVLVAAAGAAIVGCSVFCPRRGEVAGLEDVGDVSRVDHGDDQGPRPLGMLVALSISISPLACGQFFLALARLSWRLSIRPNSSYERKV
jgi:hypothetical protein